MQKRWKYEDVKCEGCQEKSETGEEILRCDQLGLNENQVQYSWFYSNLVSKQIAAGKVMMEKLKKRDIERIQKISFKIILGPVYENYNQACKYLATQSLEDRRLKLCLKFARKNLKSENCLFKKVNKNVNTRQSTKLVSDYKCRTSKYRKSSIPYLARLLNSNNKK